MGEADWLGEVGQDRSNLTLAAVARYSFDSTPIPVLGVQGSEKGEL